MKTTNAAAALYYSLFVENSYKIAKMFFMTIKMVGKGTATSNKNFNNNINSNNSLPIGFTDRHQEMKSVFMKFFFFLPQILSAKKQQ